MSKLDPAVKKETGYIAFWVILLSVIMEAVFLILRKWDLSVLIGNLGGAIAAVGSFFLLAVTVSKAVSSGKPEDAAKRVKASASLRMLGMGGLCALLAPDVKSRRFRMIDYGLIAMMILPILACIALKVLFTPASEGVNISGALVYWQSEEELGATSLYISESQVNSWAVMISILGLCLYLTHGLTAKASLKRQLVAEWIVEKSEKLVRDNMGGFFAEWGPFITAIMGLSAFSSLICLVGLFSPTGDVNVTFGWAILVFFLIMHFKFRGGLWNYFKGLFKPIPVFAPMNLIGEIATPVSMAFRHYGNILSGAVISALIGSALTGLSRSVVGWLPGVLGDMPLLRVGLPAVLSIYFDVFSGVMQAFIFAMLTMLNIAGAVPWDDWNARRKKRNKPEIQNTAA